MAYTQTYTDIIVESLLNSPMWAETCDYKETFDHQPSEEELLDLGIFVEDNALLKYFTLSVDGQPCTIKFRMTVFHNPISDQYEVTSRGAAITTNISDLIDDVALGYGYTVDGYTKEDIMQLLSDEYEGYDIDFNTKIVNGIIDIYGRSAYDHTIADLVYNYFEQFPNINNPCVVNQRPLPEGQSFISNYDHSNLINNLVAYDDNNYMSGMYTPTQFKQSLERLYNSDANFKSIIDNSQVIRTCVHSVAPEIKRMYINGYTIDNASIVTTTESGNNQHYAGVVTHVKGGLWSTSPSDFGDRYFHNEGLWDSDTGYTTADVFYNYYRTGWFAYNGLSHTALVGNGTIIDSIGISSTLSPITPISNLHTKWYEPTESNPYIPIGHKPFDPEVPEIELQPLIRDGDPPVIVKPKPTPGVLPKPFIEPVSPETFDKEVFLENCVNIYHPYVENVSDFFTWLWDRDTWADKQLLNSNPLEPIISLHTLPLPNEIPVDEEGTLQYWYTPRTSSELWKAIVLGYLTAQNMSADPPTDIVVPIVLNRVVRFCFGKVLIPRTYLDYRDFDREIYIYLPYIGFRQIRCDDITPYLNPLVVEHFAELYLDYFIDIATGDFQAIISINKNYSDKKVLYMFNGNMAVQIPLSATDKTRLEQAKFNLFMGVGTTALSMATALFAPTRGLLGAAAGLASIANSVNTIENQNVISVDRCGSLTTNFGALSPKTPYVVINSPIGYDTAHEPYCGDSSYCTVKLGTLKGFAKCKYVHVDTLTSATLEERNSIEVALLEGIIF